MAFIASGRELLGPKRSASEQEGSLRTMKGAEMASAITSRVQTTTWCIVLSLPMIAAGMLS